MQPTYNQQMAPSELLQLIERAKQSSHQMHAAGNTLLSQQHPGSIARSAAAAMWKPEQAWDQHMHSQHSTQHQNHRHLLYSDQLKSISSSGTTAGQQQTVGNSVGAPWLNGGLSASQTTQQHQQPYGGFVAGDSGNQPASRYGSSASLPSSMGIQPSRAVSNPLDFLFSSGNTQDTLPPVHQQRSNSHLNINFSTTPSLQQASSALGDFLGDALVAELMSSSHADRNSGWASPAAMLPPAPSSSTGTANGMFAALHASWRDDSTTLTPTKPLPGTSRSAVDALLLGDVQSDQQPEADTVALFGSGPAGSNLRSSEQRHGAVGVPPGLSHDARGGEGTAGKRRRSSDHDSGGHKKRQLLAGKGGKAAHKKRAGMCGWVRPVCS